MLLKLKKADFDVIHGHSYQTFPMHFSTLAKYRKLVISTHFHGASHSIFRNSLLRIFKPIGKNVLQKAYKIHAVSEYEKSLLVDSFDIDPQKIVVIPCGLDFSEFKGLQRQNRNSRSILYVGRLVSYKGVQYLVKVLKKLDSNVFLEIVGKGPSKPHLEKLAKNLNVFDRVKFYQDLSRSELIQKVADANVFALLSSHEAFSMVVAEAIMAGTPCIVSRTSALTEWIDEKNCFGINYPIDLNSLAAKLEKILAFKPREHKKHPISDKIKDWDRIVKDIEKIYTDN